MTGQFQNGEWVEYYSLQHSWKHGIYIGPRGKNQHAVEVPESGNIIIKGDGHIRAPAKRQTMQGYIIIYRVRNGKQTIVGPIVGELALKQELETRQRIFPAGPEAVLDLSAYNLTYNIGDGVPAAFLRPRTDAPAEAGVQ